MSYIIECIGKRIAERVVFWKDALADRKARMHRSNLNILAKFCQQFRNFHDFALILHTPCMVIAVYIRLLGFGVQRY